MSVMEELSKVTIECEMRLLANKLKGDLNKKEAREYTAPHLDRTAEIAVGFARFVPHTCNDEVMIRKIGWGMDLHDAGKMLIDNEIILSCKRGDEDERKEMKKHPEYGKDWLRENTDMSRIPKEVFDIILYHHEDWDGKGYPEGRFGNNTPYYVRIGKMADVWDALTTPRPYKKAWKPKNAAKYIKKNAGKRFEPTMVSYFLLYLTKEKIIPGSFHPRFFYKSEDSYFK